MVVNKKDVMVVKSFKAQTTIKQLRKLAKIVVSVEICQGNEIIWAKFAKEMKWESYN